jgi:hypothetical protein
MIELCFTSKKGKDTDFQEFFFFLIYLSPKMLSMYSPPTTPSSFPFLCLPPQVCAHVASLAPFHHPSREEGSAIRVRRSRRPQSRGGKVVLSLARVHLLWNTSELLLRVFTLRYL